MDHGTGSVAVRADGDMYSTAFGFYSSIYGTVDPRTGTYSARISFVTGQGNKLRGPHFSFSLSYDAFSDGDHGFGQGWNLGVTTLDINAGMLSLSEGDRQRVQGLLPGRPAFFPDRKLDSCSLVMGADHETAIVEHVTGMVEHLTPMGATRGTLRLSRLVQPNGDAIDLTWAVENGMDVLKKVTDTDGAVLLSLEYEKDIASAILTLHTGLSEPLEVLFFRSGRALSQVIVPNIDKLNIRHAKAGNATAWKFTYRRLSSAPAISLLAAVQAPDGTQDVVRYNDDALTVPDKGPLEHMPAVVSRKKYILDQDETVLESHTYAWTRSNFMGYPLVTQWESRADQLLHVVNGRGFVYGSTEQKLDPHSGKPLLTIVRSYNQFHLITSEVTTRGAIVSSTEIAYGNENNNVSFDDQEKSFQLPRHVTTTLYDVNSPEIKQITVVSSDYDVDGNIITTSNSASRTEETSIYYPVEGEVSADGTVLCPPDPLEVVRRLKSRTSRSADESSPVLTTVYGYCSVPVRHGTARWLKGRESYVQGNSETLWQENVPDFLIRNDKTFAMAHDDEHGTVRQETITQDGMTQSNSYSQRVVSVEPGDATGAAGMMLETIHRTHDGIENRSSETRWLISGLVQSACDTQGERTTFEYDALGRNTRTVHHAGDKDYETSTSMRYQVTNDERWMERTGITGLHHRIHFDESGHPIKQEEPLSNNEMVVVYEAVFDAFGMVEAETNYDVLTDQLITLTSRYSYDDWGQPARVTSPDESSSVSERTLVNVDGDVRTRTRQWRETPSGQRMSGWQSSETDAGGLQRKSCMGSWDGDMPIEYSTVAYEYDGLGRCIAQTDPFGRITTQSWDVFGRLVHTTLPTGDTIGRTYAPGQDSELLQTISLKPRHGVNMLLGKRDYDGLGRLKIETAGSLTRTHSYVPDQISAEKTTLPGGGILTRVFDRKLGEVLLNEMLENDTSFVKKATYNKLLGLPTSVASGLGVMDIETDYLGRMTKQAVDIGGTVRKSEVVVSLAGLELERTGVDGAKQVLTYDKTGRLCTLADAEVTTTFTYDTLSRTQKRITVDRAGRSMEQQFTYDALGRPAQITFMHDDGGTLSGRALILEYRQDNKVVVKRWKDTTGTDHVLLRTESMTYDDRGRLIIHDVTAGANATELPKDELGNTYTRQTFEHDALDNLLRVETTLASGQANVTSYTYDEIDRDRISSVHNSMAGYPGNPEAITLKYDANGHLVDDGSGHLLTWDGAGRLTSITLPDGTPVAYEYGPDGRIARVTRPERTTVRYHSDGKIYAEFTGEDNRRYIRVGSTVVAETRLAGALRTTWLLGTDPQGSVLTESAADTAGLSESP